MRHTLRVYQDAHAALLEDADDLLFGMVLLHVPCGFIPPKTLTQAAPVQGGHVWVGEKARQNRFKPDVCKVETQWAPI
jgi:hypothetical protein